MAVRELAKIAKELRSMDRRVDNLIPIWPRVGNMLARNSRRQFSTRGAFLGKPWKPLKAKTMEEKARHGFGRQPLVRSGGLKASFTGRPMGIEHYTPKSAKFGSDLNVAGWQQGGTFRNGKRAIPPRVILHMRREDYKELRRMIVDYVAKGKRR